MALIIIFFIIIIFAFINVIFPKINVLWSKCFCMIWVHLTKRVAASSSSNTMVLSKKQIEGLLFDEAFVSGMNSKMLWVCLSTRTWWHTRFWDVLSALYFIYKLIDIYFITNLNYLYNVLVDKKIVVLNVTLSVYAAVSFCC